MSLWLSGPCPQYIVGLHNQRFVGKLRGRDVAAKTAFRKGWFPCLILHRLTGPFFHPHALSRRNAWSVNARSRCSNGNAPAWSSSYTPAAFPGILRCCPPENETLLAVLPLP